MSEDVKDLSAEIEALGAKLAEAKAEIGKRFLGQHQVLDEVLITILSGGHGLLVGVPGLAKTRLVETLGTVLGLDTRRIQFTPDLMPADILGAEVLDQDAEGQKSFRFIKGPIFSELLMADEINRASPRTQSALLQAMQEREVSVAGQTHPLPAPFYTFATQNPIEQEGTYPLPEAQLDRFLLQINVAFPDRDTERDILLATTGVEDAVANTVFDGPSLIAAQTLVRSMPVGEAVIEAVLDLIRSARPDDEGASDMVRETVAWGPGPRAAQAMMLAIRARALLDGRFAPDKSDVIALAPAVLRHRMQISFAARAAGTGFDDVLAHLLGTLTHTEASAA